MRYVILGAGPTGLGAAWALQAAGADWLLYEAEAWPGGLAASFAAEGFVWDLGGHILFSHYPEFDAVLDRLMEPAGWMHHERRAFVRYREAWVPYPFQHNLRYLPPAEQAECLAGLEEAARHRDDAPPRNFREFIERSMGAGLARLFMLPYNAKVWACPPERLATQWVGDRVALPDIARLRRNIAAARDDVSWGPNNRFRFPVRGGTGAIWKALAAVLPADRIRYRHAVRAIDAGRRTVAFAGGETAAYDALISTLPLDRLVVMAGQTALQAPAGRLVHTATHVVGLGLPGPAPRATQDQCWLYFPETDYPFYRVTVFSNYSPYNARPGHYALMAEASASADRPLPPGDLAARCATGLRSAGLIAPGVEPVHVWRRQAPYGYPVPALERDAALAELQPALEAQDIYSRGRFGAWKYEVGNMDHSFMQGVEIARRLTAGAPEITLPSPETVNRPRERS